MSRGIWRAVAGAFVELEEDGAGTTAEPTDAPADAPQSAEEIEAMLANLGASPSTGTEPAAEPASAPVMTTPTPTPGVPAAQVTEEPFPDIYARMGVPTAPHSAEQVLAVLAGLQTMPLAARVQVITALDDADDNWTVQDVVGDARAKCQALDAASGEVDQALAALEAQTQADDALAAEQLAGIRTEVENQIAALQETLREAEAEAQTQNTARQVALQQQRDQAQGQKTRLATEKTRLGQLAVFATTPSTPPDPNAASRS